MAVMRLVAIAALVIAFVVVMARLDSILAISLLLGALLVPFLINLDNRRRKKWQQSQGQGTDDAWKRAQQLAAAKRTAKPKAPAPSGQATPDRALPPTAPALPPPPLPAPLPSPATPAPASDGAMTWHPLGAPARVGGRVLSNGGFYTCKKHGPCTGAIIESLPIPSSAAPDWQASSVGYWPAYRELSPGQRLAFLGYLESPRRTQHIGQAYVWLYIYNIEFRLLVEPVDAVGEGEFAALVGELEALKAAYFALQSIRRYLPALIAAATARRQQTPHPSVPPSPPALSWTEDLAVQAGSALALPGPVDGSWAYQIALLNRPVGRNVLDVIGEELITLFGLRYTALTERQRTPKLGRSKLAVHYKRAMDGAQMMIQTSVPDIRRQAAPFSSWVAVLESCLEELEPLRKARTSKTPSPFAALANVPDELAAAGALPTALIAARELLLPLFKGEAAVVTWRALTQIFGSPDTEPKKREVVHVAQALGLIGFGIEPDPRFGTGTPTTTGDVVLFRLDDRPAGTPSAAFSAGLLLVQCAAHVAAGDGVSQVESDATLALVARDLELSSSEAARLQAHLLLLSRDNTLQRRVLTQLKAMPETQRHRIARAMVAIAGADGNVDAGEVRILDRLYSTVGLPTEMLHTDIHAVLAGSDVSVPGASPSTQAGGAPPGHRARPRAGDGLDEAVIARKLAETARVHSLLSTVFVEEAPEPEVIAGAESNTDVRLALAAMLAAAAPAMDRPAWEALCEGHGLMPDAALESVNELAIEQCGEPLAEGDDPLEINTWAAGEMGLAIAVEEQS